MRSISYNTLWKKLIDLKMSKVELAEKARISRFTLVTPIIMKISTAIPGAFPITQ